MNRKEVAKVLDKRMNKEGQFEYLVCYRNSN